MSMLREDGEKEFPIWLLGDSEPVNSRNSLKTPFDSRHPVRHNIWTSIVDVMQHSIYLKNGCRIDTSKVFIRNAITDVSQKPEEKAVAWTQQVEDEIKEYRRLINEYKPQIIFTFGSFAYEFARRVLGENEGEPYKYWNTLRLGDEFRRGATEDAIVDIRIIPLLHRSISSGRFISGHRDFCNNYDDNYFNYCGKTLAKMFLANQKTLDIWMKPIEN